MVDVFCNYLFIWNQVRVRLTRGILHPRSNLSKKVTPVMSETWAGLCKKYIYKELTHYATVEVKRELATHVDGTDFHIQYA